MHFGKRAIAEFLGTFWLTIGGCGSAVVIAELVQDWSTPERRELVKLLVASAPMQPVD